MSRRATFVLFASALATLLAGAWFVSSRRVPTTHARALDEERTTRAEGRTLESVALGVPSEDPAARATSEATATPDARGSVEIEFHVQRSDGAPVVVAELGSFRYLNFVRAADAERSLNAPRSARSGALRYVAAFDEHDRVRLPRREFELASIVVCASSGEGWVSAPLRVDPDIEGPHELVLQPGGTIVARIERSDGRLAVSTSVRLEGRGPELAGLFDGNFSDANATARFRGLPLGRYALECDEDGLAAHAEVELGEPGTTREVVLRVEAQGRVLAISGDIVDASRSAAPFDALRLSIDRRAPFPIAVRADGHFEHWSEPGEEVELALGTSLFSRRYEPDALRAPFGTRDVVIHARAGPQARRVALHVVDAATRAPLEANVRLSLDDGDPRHRVSVRASETAELDVPGDVESTLELYCTGYRDVVMRCKPAEIAALDTLTIAMDPGFERAFRVTRMTDGGMLEPVRHAQAWFDGRPCSNVNSNDEIVVELPAWPRTLDFRARGFLESTWRPAAPSNALDDRDIRLIPSD